MSRIVVFTNARHEIVDFFDASLFATYERTPAGTWEIIHTAPFEPIQPSNPTTTRKSMQALLPLVECGDIIAGGALVGIPFTVFDRAGFHIFAIESISDQVFDGIIEELRGAETEAAHKAKIISDARPVETGTPGVYYLDLVALQKECPEVTSKQAMQDFLQNTPLVELRLICKHIPPWIENAGCYTVTVTGAQDGAVHAVITRKC